RSIEDRPKVMTSYFLFSMAGCFVHFGGHQGQACILALPRMVDPLMVRVGRIDQALVAAGQKIEIITVETVFRYHGMEPFGHQYHIVMSCADKFIQGEVRGVYLL